MRHDVIVESQSAKNTIATWKSSKKWYLRMNWFEPI